LGELGQLQHVFIDKTGTMTTGEFEVVEIYMNSKMFKLKDTSELYL